MVLLIRLMTMTMISGMTTMKMMVATMLMFISIIMGGCWHALHERSAVGWKVELEVH